MRSGANCPRENEKYKFRLTESGGGGYSFYRKGYAYMTKLELTLKLYEAFRRLSGGVEIVSRDAIEINPSVAISEGIWHLSSIGVLGKKDAQRLIEEYDFNNLSMDEIINDPIHMEKFIELIDVLNSIR